MSSDDRFRCLVCGELSAERRCPDDGAPTVPVTELLRAAAAPTPGAQLGAYRVGEVLGTGGMGSVVAATALDGSEVAIKRLHAERAGEYRQLQRFYREAMAVQRIDSPYVVKVFEFGFDEDTSLPFIVMERLRGKTLAQRLREGSLDAPEALEILLQVARALEGAEAARIVHRDLKPSNIFVDDRGRVKVTDFGVARLADEATLTSTDAAVGTVHYMAPEQIRGGQVDTRADLYALGCLLYEMLCGRPLYAGSERVHVLMRHITEPPPPLLDADFEGVEPYADLERLYERLVARHASGRPPSAASVVEALEALIARLPDTQPPGVFLAGGGGEAVEPLTLDPSALAPPEAPRRPRRSPLIAAAFLLGGVGAWAVLRLEPEPAPRPIVTSIAVDAGPLDAAPVDARPADARVPIDARAEASIDAAADVRPPDAAVIKPRGTRKRRRRGRTTPAIRDAAPPPKKPVVVPW